MSVGSAKGVGCQIHFKVYFEDIFDRAGSECGPLEARKIGGYKGRDPVYRHRY